jgi:hypothetical protein
MTPNQILPLLQLKAVQQGYSMYSLLLLQVSTLDGCELYLPIECIGSLHAVHAHQPI